MLTLHERPWSLPSTWVCVVIHAPGHPVPGARQAVPGAGERPVFALKLGMSVASASEVSKRPPSMKFHLVNMSMSNITPKPVLLNFDERKEVSAAPVT